MRIVIVGIVFLLACTKPNPEVCCATDEQCASLGVTDGLRPCGVGQACAADFTCVAAECETGADCLSPDTPVCSLGFCVAKCQFDEDCADASGRPFCAADGACVGCIDDTSCATDRPLCDADDRTCRGCERDSECESGVCLEADATCADLEAVIFVRQLGSDDVGTCPQSAPCKTLAYAFTQLNATRRVIHLDDGLINVPAQITVTDTLGVYLDGTDTTIGGSGTLFDVAAGASITFNRVEFPLGTSQSIVLGHDNSTIRMFDSVLKRQIETAGGLLDLTWVGTENRILCQAGTLSLRDSTFEGGGINTSDCQVTVSRTRFNDAGVSVVGGVLLYENNLAVIPNGLTDFMFVMGVSPTSSIRFSTFVNTTSVNSDGVAIACDPSLEVTSNVFAYRSMRPFQNGCGAKFSLFDEVAIATQSAGEGNVTANRSTIFVDLDGRDFHLGPSSPAKEAADSELVITEDLERNPRPQPFNTTADMGALEAP
jgi:hypothetical protein